METVFGTMRHEFLRFCHTTTLRGIPRIAKAPNKAIRTLWLTFVIGLFIGLFSCMFYLARQYLEYHVIHPPRILRDTASPFPSMTLCNLRPISPAGMQRFEDMQLRDPRGFAENLNNFSAGVYFYKKRKFEYELVTSAISMGGYLESLPVGLAANLGHTRNETIIQCRVLYLEGSSRVTQSCDKVGEWRQFSHALYLNCHTFDLKPSFSNQVLTIELYAYLNEPVNNYFCHDCFAGELKSQLSGAVVVIHNAKTYPDINQEGINLQPGTLTEIKIKTIENIQKTPPHGRCTHDTPTELYMNDNITYAYSEYGCRMMTIQAEINKRCNCNAIEFPYVNHDLPFCMALPQFINKSRCILHDLTIDSQEFNACMRQLERTKDGLLCKSKVTRKYQGDVVPTCTLPCAFYSYETDRSTSTWPTKSWQLTWLDSPLGQKVMEKPEMKEYKQANQLMKKNAPAKDIIDIIMRNNALERNLLAIMIVRPNFNLHMTGGLLSIWIGLTMICVVELIELVINCFLACGRDKTRSQYTTTKMCSCRGQENNYKDAHLANENVVESYLERVNQPLPQELD